MKYTIAVYNHIAVTKESFVHLHVLIGQRTDYELSPNDGIGLTVANKQFNDNPFRQMVGIGIRERPTEEIMRETCGEESMR